MPRKTDEDRLTKIEAKAQQLRAKVAQKIRKQRTAQLIALGLLLHKVLMHNNWALPPWNGAATQHLDQRMRENAKNALAAIAELRVKITPSSSDSGSAKIPKGAIGVVSTPCAPTEG